MHSLITLLTLTVGCDALNYSYIYVFNLHGNSDNCSVRHVRQTEYSTSIYFEEFESSGESWNGRRVQYVNYQLFVCIWWDAAFDWIHVVYCSMLEKLKC